MRAGLVAGFFLFLLTGAVSAGASGAGICGPATINSFGYNVSLSLEGAVENVSLATIVSRFWIIEGENDIACADKACSGSFKVCSQADND